MKAAILIYVCIALALVVGYCEMFLSPNLWPNMTQAEAANQWVIFQTVYFSASSGLALVSQVLISTLVKKPLKRLARVFIGYLTAQFMIDLFSQGEYVEYWEWLDHGSAIVLALYAILSVPKLFTQANQNDCNN